MQSDLRVVDLTATDIDEMMALERKVCIPLIQASPDTILKRLARGNVMIGVRWGDTLVGSIGFRHDTFSPDDFQSFPKTFGEFSTPTKKPATYDAGFVYSVNVDPEHRTLAVQAEPSKGLRPAGIGKTLVVSAAQRMTQEACVYLVGDGRPAFYNGSSDFPQERYDTDAQLKSLLDKCASGHTLSDDEASLLLAYPIFAAYNKSLGGGLRVAWVIPNFFPADTPAGGFRVILYKRLQ